MYTLSLDISSFMIPLDQRTVVILKASAITIYYLYTTTLPLPYRPCLSVRRSIAATGQMMPEANTICRQNPLSTVYSF